MTKRVVQLKEKDIRNIIKESVNKILCHNIGKENLFEMANIYPEDTGLKCIVWVQSASPTNHGRHNTPRVKVQINNDMIPISIEDTPKILANGGNELIDIKLFNQITMWIRLNKDVLQRYYTTPMSTKDFLNSIQRIN